MSKKLAVMVIIETDDPRLDIDRLDVSTAAKAAEVRKAVIDNLPRLERVVMVTSEEEAKIMCAVRDAVARDLGHEAAKRPPPGYVPPTRE